MKECGFKFRDWRHEFCPYLGDVRANLQAQRVRCGGSLFCDFPLQPWHMHELVGSSRIRINWIWIWINLGITLDSSVQGLARWIQ